MQNTELSSAERLRSHPKWVAAREDEEEKGVTIWVGSHSAEQSHGSGAPEMNFDEQFALSLERLEATLHEAGAALSDVVSVRAYVQNPADLERFEALYGQRFALGSNPSPVRTVLCNCLRPDLLFEIECVALRPGPNLHVGG